MIDFKQKTDDGYAAGKACREWEEERQSVVIDLEKRNKELSACAGK